MDYIKLIFFLFPNFGIFFIFVLIVMLKKERKDSSLQKSRRVPQVHSDLEITIELIIFAVFLFIIFTIPILRDMPYLLTQNYVEANGNIIKCDKESIVATITNENQETKNIEIPGDYNLDPDTTIIVEYLPHMDLRVDWYTLDPETKIKEKPRSNKIALIDNEAFLLSVGLGIPAIVSFAFMIFLNKIKNMPAKFKQMISYIAMIAGLIALLSVLRLSQL